MFNCHLTCHPVAPAQTLPYLLKYEFKYAPIVTTNERYHWLTVTLRP